MQAYNLDDFEPLVGINVKFDYKPSPEYNPENPKLEQHKKGVVVGFKVLKYGDGVFLKDMKVPLYIKNISYLQVPCYLNCIVPFLSNCLRSEGVIPSLLACPTELAEL